MEWHAKLEHKVLWLMKLFIIAYLEAYVSIDLSAFCKRQEVEMLPSMKKAKPVSVFPSSRHPVAEGVRSSSSASPGGHNAGRQNSIGSGTATPESSKSLPILNSNQTASVNLPDSLPPTSMPVVTPSVTPVTPAAASVQESGGEMAGLQAQLNKASSGIEVLSPSQPFKVRKTTL